jgi:signal transduction histidine kinase
VSLPGRATPRLLRMLRLLAALLLCTAAGALATQGQPRALVAAALLAALGLALALPLARSPQGHPAPPPEAPAPDGRRLARLQAQFEHLPVAVWELQAGPEGAAPRPLSARARRLEAPGGVRARAALHQLLGSGTPPGPVLLDTERGAERWQLQRQSLALDGQALQLLALVPLENELEAESLRAWQELVRVLTHEIMNSLTPLQSLSQTALVLIDEPAEPVTQADLRTALQAIQQRSQGLARFVATYRRASHWPAPQMAPVALQGLFARLQQAITPAWAARGGSAVFELASPTLCLQADAAQLEQALLALLHNAAQATADTAAPRLWVAARQGRGGRLQISVRDNGPGVAPGLERQIFLPFFTTREEGQGVGLTVVRQLVHGMGGRVRHVRPLEGGAAFVLSF